MKTVLKRGPSTETGGGEEGGGGGWGSRDAVWTEDRGEGSLLC